MMTYLSYFTQDNGVGEKWTLGLVNGWNTGHPVENFNTDWNDGQAVGMCEQKSHFSFGQGCVVHTTGWGTKGH